MQSYDILTYGLTAEETNQLQKNIPLNYSAFVTECFTDIIATPVSGIVVGLANCLSMNEICSLIFSAKLEIFPRW